MSFIYKIIRHLSPQSIKRVGHPRLKAIKIDDVFVDVKTFIEYTV